MIEIRRGWHSIAVLWEGFAIKVYREAFRDRAEKEFRILQFLSPLKIAPDPYFASKNFVVMEKLEGVEWGKMPKKLRAYWLEEAVKLHYLLDMLGIDKGECHRPEKHLILTKEGLKLIDFERAKTTEKPKNLTGFLSAIYREFKKDVIKQQAVEYKRGKTGIKEILTSLRSLLVLEEKAHL